MGQRVLVGGTGYDLFAGRVLVGGTGYDIIKGRALIDSTGQDISFISQAIRDFINLMTSADVTFASAGRDARSGSECYLNTADVNQSDFVFVVCNGEMSINFINYTEGTGGIVALYQSSVSGANLTYTETSTGSRRRYPVSNTRGGSPSYPSGATIMRARFGPNCGYTVEEIKSILSSVVKVGGAGRNEGSASDVSFACRGDSALLVAHGNSLGIFSPVDRRAFVYAPAGSNEVDLYYEGGVARVSDDGESALSVYGASIIQLE